LYGTGLVMAYKRLEAHRFVWPQVGNGLILLNPAQLKTLSARHDWQDVQPIGARALRAIA